MILNLTHHRPNGKERALEAVISEDNSKIYIPPDWQGYSLHELLTNERLGAFVRLEISRG